MKTRCLLGLFVLTSTAFAADTPYTDAIKSLSPNYYYELNETDVDQDVIDTMGNASEVGVYNGDYADSLEFLEPGFGLVGCEGPSIINDIPTMEENPDFVNKFGYEPIAAPGLGEGNLAHCSYDAGHIELGPGEEYGASDMTVAMFFRHEEKSGTTGERLFTNNLTDAATSFQINVGGEGIVVAVNPNDSGDLAERTLWNFDIEDNPDGEPDRAVIDGDYGWFHIVASTHGAPSERAGNIRVWINGTERSEDLVTTTWGWGVNTEFAKIGGRHDDPSTSTTHSGAQDEVAIWLDRVLSEEEVASIWEAAVGTSCQASTGDIDGNGTIEFADFLTLSANFGTAGGSAEGDLDCDGEIAFSDFLILSGNFGQTVAASQSVPEPAAGWMMLCAAAMIGMFRTRR